MPAHDVAGRLARSRCLTKRVGKLRLLLSLVASAVTEVDGSAITQARAFAHPPTSRISGPLPTPPGMGYVLRTCLFDNLGSTVCHRRAVGSFLPPGALVPSLDVGPVHTNMEACYLVSQRRSEGRRRDPMVCVGRSGKINEVMTPCSGDVHESRFCI